MQFIIELFKVTPAVVMFTECLVRSPLRQSANDVSKTAMKSMRVVTSKRISDHWKEKVLLQYSCKLLTSSCALCFWLFTCVGVFAISFAAAEMGISRQLILEQLVPSFSEMVLATIVGVLYGIIRFRHE